MLVVCLCIGGVLVVCVCVCVCVCAVSVGSVCVYWW